MMFNDGVVKIYRLENVAEEGNRPVEKLKLKETLRYKERTVGMGRYWTGFQNNVKIDRLLRVNKRNTVSTQDVAIPNDGNQYIVKQVQYIEDLKVMDISLERIEQDYDLD